MARAHAHLPWVSTPTGARSSVDVPVRGCTPQWSARSDSGVSAAVLDAAEQQAKLHAQHARNTSAFDTRPPRSFFEDAELVTLKPGSVLYVPGERQGAASPHC